VIQGQTKPAVHGRDHTPEGPDAVYCGPWYYVGSGDTMPDGTIVPGFENGWQNVGGTKVPMRFRLVLGPPNLVRRDGTVDIVIAQKQTEIQGDVIGGANGTTVFTAPPSHRPDYDTPVPGHDTNGLYVACRFYADGRFVRGVA